MRSEMEYNEYHAKVEYDGCDNIFVGSVIGMNDYLAFHGSSVDVLETSFKNCIDNYLRWCDDAGKKPEKEFKGMFNVRISPESHREAAMEAAIDGITMDQFAAETIDEKIARRKAVVV